MIVKNYDWYIFGGEAGVLSFNKSGLFKGVDFLDKDEDGLCFYAFSDMSDDVQVLITSSDVESIAPYVDDASGSVIVCADVRDGEGLLGRYFCVKSYWEDDLYERELCDLGRRDSEAFKMRNKVLHTFNNVASRSFDDEGHLYEELSKVYIRLKDEWEGICSGYVNNYSLASPVTLDEMILSDDSYLGYWSDSFVSCLVSVIEDLL